MRPIGEDVTCLGQLAYDVESTEMDLVCIQPE